MNSPSGFSPQVDRALERAGAWQAGRRPADDGEPFASQRVVIAGLLRDAGCSDEVVVAGVLHDALEHTTVGISELSATFGAEVAGLVVAVSDDLRVSSYRRRKRALRARVRQSPDGALLILAADLIADVRELGRLARGDPTRYGPDSDDETVRSRLEHYRASLIMLIPLAGRHALVRLLVAELGAYDRMD